MHLRQGLGGSGLTLDACNYLPAGQKFELTYLHKLLNIAQYLDLPTVDAANATFDCVYPNSTVVRHHLTLDLTSNASNWIANYSISKIGSSWERMGYLSQQFDEGEYGLGGSFEVMCTDINYSIPGVEGNIIVSLDNFTFEFRNRTPFIVNATTIAVIGNGTQEAVVLYSITNNETYTVTDAVLEINAPQYGTFIGTRAELWGEAKDFYRLEKSTFAPGETVNIYLVVRFDTSSASNLAALNLSSGVNTDYITCWELGAYNPNRYNALIPVDGNVSVNLSTNTSIINIPEILISINNTVTSIENITTIINNTVNNIETIVEQINTTTNLTYTLVNAVNETVFQINATVNDINATVNVINNTVNMIKNMTNLIYNDTQLILDFLNCSKDLNLTNTTTVCDLLLGLNSSIYQMNNTLNNINQSIFDLNNSIENYFNLTLGNLSYLAELINNISINASANLTIGNESLFAYFNCTHVPNTYMCTQLANIGNYVNYINTTTFNTLDWLNNTIWGNLTAQDIINNITGLLNQNTNILNQLYDMEDFNEELVFLVTDSFNLQAGARDSAARGDFTQAASQLKLANQRLEQLSQELNSEAIQLQGTATAYEVTDGERTGIDLSRIAFYIFLIGGNIFLLVYIFRPVEVYEEE